MKKITYLTILIVVLAACKKYEEGPFISIRTPKNRLKGDWSFAKYTNNGVDSTAIMLAKANFFFKWGLHIGYSSPSEAYCFIGTMDVNSIWDNDFSESNYEYLKFTFIPSQMRASENLFLVTLPTHDTISERVRTKWKVMKLSNRELKIRYVDSNNNPSNIFIEYEKSK
ncbi:MAG: hypothetical protein WCK02_13585 [Bacteroidota bacterium]